MTTQIYSPGHRQLPPRLKHLSSNMGRIGLAILIYNYIKLLRDYVLFEFVVYLINSCDSYNALRD